MNNLLKFVRKAVFTMTGGGQAASMFGLMARRIAFTMAEILLSLTIIGVVAAITLPSLTGNINERTWNTQRKALYSRLSQAIALMPSIRGYGASNLSGYSAQGAMVYCVSSAAETFLTSGLSKVLKMNNICGGNLGDCGLPATVTPYGGGSQVSIHNMYNIAQLNSMFGRVGCGVSYVVDSQVAAFETANGESLMVHYNPLCKDKDWYLPRGWDISPSAFMCVNMVYDLNGKKGPNILGKDVGFMTVFYSDDPVVVAPIPLASNAGPTSWSGASSACRAKDSDSRAPNIEELMSLGVNTAFMDSSFKSNSYWSSSVFESSQGYIMSSGTDSATVWTMSKSESKNVRCVKR